MSILSQPSPAPRPSPPRHLSLFDSTSIIVGIIIGSTIYLSTPTIARQVPDLGWLVAVWAIGAAFALVQALCYAELATAYPHEGGDYVFLSEAFGRTTGFFFAWGQFWIIRPGSVGMLAYVFAHYAQQLCPLDVRFRPVLIYATAAVAVLAGINLLGVQAGKWTQNVLTVIKFLGLSAVVVVGMVCAPAAAAPALPLSETPAEHPLNLGFAMIFVFLAYSGANEMAYVSAEVRHPRKNILRALVLGIVAVAALYIALNLAFVHAIGLDGVRRSTAVAADVLTLGLGHRAGQAISLLICITALSGINGMIFTGARILYAIGADHRFFAALGRSGSQADAPMSPMIIQAVVAIALTVGFGWFHEGLRGFEDSVAFTSPPFWLFLYLVGHSLFVLRARQSPEGQVFRVPLYPIVPFLFCLANAYMFFKSLDYAIQQTPWGLLAAAIIMAVGAVIGWAGRPNAR